MLSFVRTAIRALFLRHQVEDELDDELRFHFDQQVEKHLKAGLNQEEATRLARLGLGGMEQVKEACRQAAGLSFIEGTLQDLRYALRGLRRDRVFSAVVILSLALGIGANTAIFTLMNAVLWKTLPVTEPETLLALARRGTGEDAPGFRFRELRHLREHNRWLTEIGAYAPVRINVNVDGWVEPTATGQLVSGSYFGVLGVRAAAGRTIGPEDDRLPDAHPVAMISHGYWERRFGRDPAIVGRQIRLSGRSFTVVGVTPPEFFGLEVGAAPDIFAPVMMQPTLMPAAETLVIDDPINGVPWLRLFGRLPPATDSGQAAAGLDTLVKQVALAPKGNRRPSPNRLVLLPAAQGLSALRAQFSQPLAILMAVVAVVLLIACCNTVNLLLARSVSRRQEFTVRLALGAGRARLLRQLLVESVTLGLLGGAAGLLLAQGGTRFLVALMAAGQTPIDLDLSPDLRVLAFTAGIAMLAGVLFGLWPAFRNSRPGAGPLTPGEGRTLGSSGLPLGKAFAVSQLTLSLLLLVGAGLFLTTLGRLDRQDGRGPRERLLTLRVEPRGSDQRGITGTSQRLDRTYRDLLTHVRQIPGVSSAGLAQVSPTAPIPSSSNVEQPVELAEIPTLMVYPGYFSALGLPLVAGRDFQDSELGAEVPPRVVINETLGRRLFPGKNPVGAHLITPRHGGPVSREIIGVVGASRYPNLRAADPPTIYQPFLQTNTGRGQMVLHVRTHGPAAALAPRIREEVQRIDLDLPLFATRTLAEELDAVLVRERLLATLSGFFGALALLLASIGLYGLFAFSVVRRTREIGIRVALGATAPSVVWMILREALVLVGFGLALGLLLALAAGHLAQSQLEGLLFGLTARDPLTLAAASALLSIVAVLAAYLPARRASRASPMLALRAE